MVFNIMNYVYTLLVLVGLLLLSLLRYICLGWEVKKLLECFGKKDNATGRVVKALSSDASGDSDQEVFISGHYKFNKRSGLIVVVADSAGLIFRRFLLFSVLVEWRNINRISIFENRAKIYFKKESNRSNEDCISVPWSQHMTEVTKGQVDFFGDE